MAPTTQISFKNCAPFTKSITKIDGRKIVNSENLNLVMPTYNQENIVLLNKTYGFIQKRKQLILKLILQTLKILYP